ncbi:MAG: hypothetical protein ABIS23_00415 [Sphingomicrobium sp.]
MTGMQLALASEEKPKGWRLRLPPAVPPFNTRTHQLFSLVWIAAFLLAIVGPAAGIYVRYTAPKSNSQLLLGSRAGIAVSPRDATQVRFVVGTLAREAGLRRGDQIIAVYGLPLPKAMPVNEEALAERVDDPAYIAMGNLLFGTDEAEVPLTVRDADGQVREVNVVTSEKHIDSGATSLGISPTLLSFIDLLPVLSYPFLLWAAWILHRRNARDAVSSILSLAVLLTIGSEQPSSTFLASVGVPRGLNVALFDLGNILLLAGILLFPHGKLSWRLVALLAALPVLLFLQGTIYQGVFVSFMVLAVLMLLRCMRATPSSDLRQQIRFALFGFTGYALFRALSIACDFLKWSTSSFGSQLFVEVLAGVALALAVLVLQAGLLVALLRYRLYDAEAIISRTASIAIVTILLGAAFAGVMEGIITQMQNIYPDSQTPAAMIGAMVAVMLIEPVHRKVRVWAEKRFHKSLLELKNGLPEAMRDLRDVTSFEDFIDEVLTRVTEGVLARRVAFVLGREVKQQIGVTRGEVLRWLAAFQPGEDDEKIECQSDDPLFPLRVRVEDGSGSLVGWLLIGPRPDGSIAGKDEREALENIVVPLARSLRIVLARESEKKEMLDLLESHRQRIERIELALNV